jgi:hypothetical protein
MPSVVIEPAKLSAFKSRTGLSFSGPEILKEALTHKSFMDKNDLSHGRLQLMGGGYSLSIVKNLNSFWKICRSIGTRPVHH